MQRQQRKISPERWIPTLRSEKMPHRYAVRLRNRLLRRYSGGHGSRDLLLRHPKKSGRRGLSHRELREAVSGYLFLLPSLLGTGIFVLLPFLDVFRRSFLQAVGSGFVGLDNYRQVLANEAFAGRRAIRPGLCCSAFPSCWHCPCAWRSWSARSLIFKGGSRPDFLCPWRFRQHPWLSFSECCLTRRAG